MYVNVQNKSRILNVSDIRVKFKGVNYDICR